MQRRRVPAVSIGSRNHKAFQTCDCHFLQSDEQLAIIQRINDTVCRGDALAARVRDSV